MASWPRHVEVVFLLLDAGKEVSLPFSTLHGGPAAADRTQERQRPAHTALTAAQTPTPERPTFRVLTRGENPFPVI